MSSLTWTPRPPRCKLATWPSVLDLPRYFSDLNLDIPKGAITALIGPTGSGKTTFLRSLNRMNDRVSKHWHRGEVLLEGSSIYAPGVQLMALRRRVGMVFQRPNPFPMSIAGNILSGVKAHRIAGKEHYHDIVEARLREVGLWDAVSNRLNSSPFSLSGGQQQLLCLARALAIGPEVLLLDEPTSSLDPVTTENIEAMIRSLVPALTIIIVTHNLGRRAASQTPRSSSTKGRWSSSRVRPSSSKTRNSLRRRGT